MVTIYGSDGTAKTQVPCDDNSTQAKELQGDNVLTLSFTLYEHVVLEVNDYAEFLGERYWIMERYKPEQVSTVEWKYDLRLYGIESLIKRFLVLNNTDGADEAVFTLTAPPREHVALIVKSINEGMGTTEWKVGEVAGTGNIVIDYDGKYCNEALKEVAEKAGNRAEWWIDGLTVNVCYCAHGEEITLGYGKGLTFLSCDTADNVQFYTRLYPLGSSRNIDLEKYGHARLQLPGGVKHVDVNVEKYGVWHRYEAEAFAGIYPKYTGTVSSVRSKEATDEDGSPYKIYYFKDDDLPFDPNDYEIGDKVKRVSFQEGSDLAGLGHEEDGTYFFEANFDSETREWEIITTWPYDDGTAYPNDTLAPEPGDRYIPWNFRMPDEYYPLAEQEFLEAVHAYNEENALDVARYKAPTDHVYVEEKHVDLSIGRRVRLESTQYFPETGFRSSRVTKITRQVNLPSQMELEISDAVSAGMRESIDASITDIRNYVRETAGSFPDVVRSWENTPAGDYNVFSSKRTLKEIEERALSRLHTDDALALIRFLEGLHVGEAIDSMTAGAGIVATPGGRLQAERLESRTSLVTLELIYNRLSAMEGDYSFSTSGTIETVTQEADGTYTLKMRRRWEHDFTAFREHDIIYGVVNDLASEDGGYYASWLRVLSVDTVANTLSATLYPDAEVPGGVNHAPEPLMVVTQRGNPVDDTRQGWWYLSTTEWCLCMLGGVTKPILETDNYHVIVGRLKHLELFDNLPINYLRSYIFVSGLVVQDIFRVNFQGTLPRVANNRGAWSLAVAQGGEPYNAGRQADTGTGLVEMYDTVWHYGCEWMCLSTGTTDEPKYGAQGWAMVQGNPAFSIDIDSSNGWYFDADKFNTTLSVVGTLYNQDVTASILDADVSWTRDTGNVTEDNAWAVAHAGAGKSIKLTVDDLGPDYLTLTGCKFIAKAVLRDGQEERTATNYVTF